MAPQLKVDVILLELEYCEDLDPEYPIIKKPDIKILNNVGNYVYHWLNEVMLDEFKKRPRTRNLELNTTLWRIKTGEPEHFQISGEKFDKVVVVIGEETIHFMHLHRPRGIWLKGCCPLVDSICSCCFGDHYLKVMQTIKDDVIKSTTACFED